MSVGAGHNGGPPFPETEDRERPGNWFAVSRDIFDHPIVGIHDRSFTDTEAWLYMLSIASYAQTEVVNKGSIIVLDPGQLMAAHSFLASRWKWSPDKVRWYLKRLGDEAMISRYAAVSRERNVSREINETNTKQRTKQHTNQSTNQSTKRNTNQIQIITICNYAIYQYVQQQLHQAKPQATHQAAHQPQHQASHQESNTKNTFSAVKKDSMRTSADAEDAPIHDVECFEYPAEHGVLVNGKTIRHETGAFCISLPAIHIAAKPSKWPEEDINARCLTRALDWGKRLGEGMPVDLVIPRDVVVSLSAEIMHDAETAKAEARADRAAKKGTSLQPDWVLPKSWGEWAYNRFDVAPERIRKEAGRFKDYWLAATRNSTKKDWQAAWRVWCSSDKLGWRERSSYRAEGHELPVAIDTIDPDMAAYQADLEKARTMLRSDPDDH